jgi:hypothetical protein
MASWLIPLVMSILAGSALLFVLVSEPRGKGGANRQASESPIARPSMGLKLRAPLQIRSANKFALGAGLIGLTLVLIAILVYT